MIIRLTGKYNILVILFVTLCLNYERTLSLPNNFVPGASCILCIWQNVLGNDIVSNCSNVVLFLSCFYLFLLKRTYELK